MKLRIPIYILTVLGLAVIQTTILESFKIFGVKPNLLFVFTVCYSIVNGSSAGTAAGFLCGAVLDILTGKLLWLNSLFCMYSGLTAGLISRRFFKENAVVCISVTFVLSVFYGTLMYALADISSFSYEKLIYSVKNIILPESFINSAVSVLMLLFVLKSEHRFADSE